MAQAFSAFRMSPLNDRSISMQNPPDSAATPTIPAGQEEGAAVEIVWFLSLSRLDGPMLPSCSSVILKLACALPIGVVRLRTTSPVSIFGATVTGISIEVGFPA